MDVKYIFYFLAGGLSVSVVTYFASHSRGLLAAFFANLPVITAITFLTIYFESGQGPVVSYARGLIVMLFPWLAYIFTIIFLTPRAGFLPSLGVGIFLYLITAFLIILSRRF
jgi:hypothetical protein